MLIKRFGFIISVSFVINTSLILIGCTSKKDNSETLLKQYVQTADSFTVAGKGDSASTVLLKQRIQFKNDNPQLSGYYSYMAAYYQNIDPSVMVIYADSALAVFSNNENIKNYPDEYFKALLTKGDASVATKQYETALLYYDKAKKLLAKGSCDNGNLASKIAGIYFNQENYNMAARCWVESYNRLVACHKTYTAQALFYKAQGDLDNIGVSYQHAGNFDSAAYYYKKDLAYINKTEAAGTVDKKSIIAPRIVVYDNLGGLFLVQGNLADAEKYLSASVNIPYKDVDGMRITPFVKRAQLYLKTGRYDKAEADFKESRRLLDIYGKDNAISDIDWNRFYAQYLFTLHQPEKAFQYQAKYIHLKDSLEKTHAKIHRLDVDRELNSINRENLLAELAHNAHLEKIYIVGATTLVILLLAISLFINRVLKESRKNHENTRLHNARLQQALDELELANKNTIRIMRIMAHDLRNPLAGMIGLTNAILADNPSDESKHMLKLLEATGVHSLEMINELLKSGLADENEPMTKEKLDINELLHDSVELLQFKANEKKQQIVFKGAGQPIITHVNQEKIWRVFNNLIVNAIKFSYEGGMIFVSINTVADENKIIIAIADNGMGIPEQDKDKIFEMFTSAKRPGTDGEQPFGLGLSISKRIIDNHKGKLWFESPPGYGTTFYVELPL